MEETPTNHQSENKQADEFHGKITPPNSNPKRRASVTPTIVMLPTQSIAFSPASIGVEGESRCRKKDKNIKAREEQGTVTSC